MKKQSIENELKKAFEEAKSETKDYEIPDGESIDYIAATRHMKARREEEDRQAALRGETVDRSRKPRRLDIILAERKVVIHKLKQYPESKFSLVHDELLILLNSIDHELISYYGKEKVHAMRIADGLTE